MSRHHRVSPPGYAQHVLNRANDRKRLFTEAADYIAFLRLMRRVGERVPLELFAYCLMPTHFHFVVRVEHGDDLSAYMRLLLNAHVRQHHRRRNTVGRGHVYQGRFKNFVIGDDRHLLTVLRYVEMNPVRAGLVGLADEWPWCSASRLVDHPDRPALAAWPIAKPANWQDCLKDGLDAHDLERLRVSVVRGRPYGDSRWERTSAVAAQLRHTFNPQGRPRSPVQS